MKDLLKKLGIEEEQAKSILAFHNETIEINQNQVKELQNSLKLKEKESVELSEKHISEIKNLKIDSAIELSLIKNNAKNVKMGKALIDMDKIQINDDGTITGLNEQIESLTKGKDTSFLFEKDTVLNKGNKPTESPDRSIVKGDISKMSYNDFLNHYENGGIN